MLPLKETFGVVCKEKTVYKDSWFDHLAIHYLSQSLQQTTGMIIYQAKLIFN